MKLGAYQVLAKIGQGGMAEVFKAVKAGAQGFEKKIALKRIIPPYADKQNFIEMLFEEAHLQAQLDHPNLVQVYDFANDGSQYYLIMEYIEGPSLRLLSKQLWAKHSTIPWQVSLYILTQVLKALHYVHHKQNDQGPLNIVHRDISPQNILISKHGHVKLSDFGIAWSNIKKNHTKTGVLKGKVPYLSPEQVLGKQVDAQSDLFSCAVVLYELICQKSPFLGQSDYETMKNIEQGLLPDSKVYAPDIPATLHHVLQRALHRDPKQRFSSSTEFISALNKTQDPQWLQHGDLLFEAWLKKSYHFEDHSTESKIHKTLQLTQSHRLHSHQKKQKKTLFWVYMLCLSMIISFVVWDQSQLIQDRLFNHVKLPTDKTINLETTPALINPINSATPQLQAPLNQTKKKPSMLQIQDKKNIRKTHPQEKKIVNTPIRVNTNSAKLGFYGPQGSQVFINGKPMAILPADSVTLPSGKYLIMWRLSSGERKIQRLDLQAGIEKILVWDSF